MFFYIVNVNICLCAIRYTHYTHDGYPCQVKNVIYSKINNINLYYGLISFHYQNFFNTG